MQSAAVRPLCDVTPSACQSGRRAALRAAAAALTLRLAPARAEEDEAAVRAAVAAALQRAVPAGKAPAVLRLAFHDAGTYNAALGTGGPNASVLFELERPESFGLKRGLRPVQDAAELLKGTAAERLSFADLIQLAGAHAVAVTGGPAIAVPLGRVDTAAADPEGRMPEETLDGPALKAHFAAAGFSARELVALSGAHTIGGKGFGALFRLPPALLLLSDALSSGEPLRFDNTYFRTLLAAPWADASNGEAAHIGLESDHKLTLDPECKRWVEVYAANEQAWRSDFAAAYVKMGVLGAEWGNGASTPPFESRA